MFVTIQYYHISQLSDSITGRKYPTPIIPYMEIPVSQNPRLRLEVFHVTVKRPSKVGQRKVRSLVRNRNNVTKAIVVRFSAYIITFEIR